MSTVSAGLPDFICGLFFVHNLLNTGYYAEMALHYTWLPYFNKVFILCTSSTIISPRASLSSKKRGFGIALVLMSASWSLDVT